jgi:FkbM family methyltransferase
MRLALGDWLGRHVYATGEYEPATAAVIKAILRPGDTFVDVGANVGYFTLLGASRVGPRGRVFAFEPVPHLRKQLAANVRLNRFATVTVRGEAIAEQPGEAEFFLGPADHCGTSSLRSVAGSAGTLTVRTGRLDDMLPAEQKVRLIKIDVEGAEYAALCGMHDCLRRHHPDLVIEVTDAFLRAMGHSAEMLFRFLRETGYRMYVIDHRGLVPVAAFGGPLPDQFNALFTAGDP